jgi:hypothetical protein
MRWIFPARIPDIRDFSAPIHDGDTVWLTLDRGYGDRTNHDERFKLTSAPELKDPGGPETHQFVLGWLSVYAPPLVKWPLAVETFTTRTGNDITTLGRYVAMIYAGDPEQVRTNEAGLPCLNRAVNEFLEGHPEWGHGTI